MIKTVLRKATPIAGAIVSLALSCGTVVAQSPKSEPTQKESASQSLQSLLTHEHGAWLQPSKMLVTGARQIIGQDLTDNAGGHAGTIKYLMIRIGTGDVIYALASADGSSQFFAVPWDAIDKDDWIGWKGTGLRLDISPDDLKQMRRFELQDVHRLTTPIASEEVTGYYGVAPEPAFEESDSFLLFGTVQSGTIARPATQLDNQLVGSKVIDADGNPVGEIDEVMVDVDRGVVPYVLVSQAGFLGTGERWLPIVPQALKWSGDRAAYSVDVMSSKLKDLELTGDPTLAVFIRVSDLEKLYDFYDVEPYWPS